MTENGALPSVLFVTSELIGPFRNGGIGTATTGLVETVAAMGCRTTVFYTGAIWHIEIDMRRWIDAYGKLGIELVPAALTDMQSISGPIRDQGLGAAYLVYDFMKSRRFDIVHFNDTLGEGMHVLAAKHLGVGFHGTRMMLGLHSPTRWLTQLNRQPMDSILHAAFDWAERVSVRSADVLWGPSEYLLDTIRQSGWRMPTEVVCRQYVMPTRALFQAETTKFDQADVIPPARTIKPVVEIVFFGRLEERKGLRTFCGALDRLADRLAGSGVRVTFLGKPVPQDGETSADWLKRRTADWRFAWRIEPSLGQPEAVAYLTGRSCVAVMPSPYDNSPCTIYEALQHGVAFLASATGGIPELIHPDDAGRALFDNNADGLAAALDRVLSDGVATIRPRIEPAENRRRWQAVHETKSAEAAVLTAAPATRYVVLVDHGGDDDGTVRTVESVRTVLGDRLARAIVLTDRPPARGAPQGVVLLDMRFDDHVGRSLAGMIGEADAPWLVCIAGGATLAAETLPALERALASPDIGSGVIPAARAGDRIVPPMGGSRAFGFFHGYCFTGGAVIERDCAMKTLVGSTTLLRTPFAGLIDLVAAEAGDLWPFPEPLFVLGPRPLPPVAMDGLRIEAFAAAEPIEAAIIRSIGACAYKRASLNRLRRMLLSMSDLPGYARCHAALGRLLSLTRR